MLRDRVVALALSSVVVGGFSFGTEAKSYRWNCVYTQQVSPKGNGELGVSAAGPRSHASSPTCDRARC
jgi:hypothetical protein